MCRIFIDHLEVVDNYNLLSLPHFVVDGFIIPFIDGKIEALCYSYSSLTTRRHVNNLREKVVVIAHLHISD